MPIRIAITTNDLTLANVSFAAARQAVFYEVSEEEAVFVDVVRFAPTSPAPKAADNPKAGTGRNGGSCMAGFDDGLGGDPLAVRVRALAGSAILFTMALSDPAAVRMRDAGIFPVKMESARQVDEIIAELQQAIRHKPPRWIRKAMGQTPSGAEALALMPG